MEMRKVFATELENLMQKNKKICLLDADLAKASGTIKLREVFPTRAFDVGIADIFRLSQLLRLLPHAEFATRLPFQSLTVCKT